MAVSILSDIPLLTIVVHIANYSYRLLKYFHGYWQATKIILSNIFNNKIIPDENFQTMVLNLCTCVNTHTLCIFAYMRYYLTQDLFHIMLHSYIHLDQVVEC